MKVEKFESTRLNIEDCGTGEQLFPLPTLGARWGLVCARYLLFLIHNLTSDFRKKNPHIQNPKNENHQFWKKSTILQTKTIHTFANPNFEKSKLNIPC